MGSEFRIECENCESTTVVLVESAETPKFCSMCGSSVEPEDISEIEY